MQEWLGAALTGLVLGMAVSILNHLILLRALGKETEERPGDLKNAVLKSYFFRYFLNIATMLLVRKNTPMLIATALGLMLSKHALVVKFINGTAKRKGVN